jgi:deazaflavin-dependent oxidoreductase (nitroreductase family)
MRRVLRWLAFLVAFLLSLGAALYALSESVEVVILHSRDASGVARSTHLWVVDDAGAAWLRSGGRERGWFAHLAANPEVELERGGDTRAYTAVVVDTAEAASRVSEKMREKYGWIDALIERLEGGWDPIAVRLEPR